MSIDPGTAFDRLITALEEFHAAVISSRDPEEPAVTAATDALADAYTFYDDVIFTQFGVEPPLDTIHDEYDDEDDEDFDDDEDDVDFDDDLDDDDDDEDDDFDDEDDDFDDEDDDFDEDEDEEDDEAPAHRG